MNTLRLIKIYELKGKVHPIEEYVIDLLEGIEIVQVNQWIYYKKYGKNYFDYNLIINEIWLYYDFFNIFASKCSSNESNKIFKYLLEKHLNLTINVVW